MKNKSQVLRFVVVLFLFFIANSFHNKISMDQKTLTGAWHWQEKDREETVLLIDDYLSHTAYDKANKKFYYTWGGPYKIEGSKLQVKVEFHTRQKEMVGTTVTVPFIANTEGMVADFSGREVQWKQVDNATGALAGNWRITGRMQGDQLVAMNPGARKTIKLLTGTRFQWAAINTETKEFFGTGGGRYTFTDGKYTEYIEFFSRDSTRVGASLTFDGKVENNEWTHSGLSSRGDKIHEVWSRGK